MPSTLEDAYPALLMPPQPPQTEDEEAQAQTEQTPQSLSKEGYTEDDVVKYVVEWKNKLRRERHEKESIWNECWQLYRGVEDFSDKQEWQSKITLPKVWSSVKQAVSAVKRLLSTAKNPWTVEPINPDDLPLAIRSSQLTDLVKVFLEKANFEQEFAEGLECGFVIGLGVWKLGWVLEPRARMRVISVVQTPDGQTQEIPSDQAAELAAQGLQVERQMVREEVLEGKLMVRAVDPYNFWWLPGSKLNRWTGTIEEIELPKWELMDLAEQGIIDEKRVKDIQSKKIREDQKQSRLRFSEPPSTSSPSPDTDTVVLTEFYGPLILNGKIVERHAHILIANDQTLLVNKKNTLWSKKPPYVAFSPLTLPFRTEGVGLVEMVRGINKSLNRLANMGMDTLLFRLLPLFEVHIDAYENPEELAQGLVPGQVLKRNSTFLGQPGIVPIRFDDISAGTTQMAAALDRYHQEGALVSEIQQAIPRYRGVQTATEIETKAAYQDSFFGAMAADIESTAIQPIIEMALSLVLQFLDTADDPRVASILGVNAQTLKAMSREEILELVQGDYKVKATGITSQLQKAEVLQNLVQLMNIIGQNPEAWMPYVNQDALLRRVLEAFRPAIREIEDIVADPETAQAKQMAAQERNITPEMVGMIPQLVQMALQAKQQEQQAQLQQQQIEMQQQQQMDDRAMQLAQMEMQQQQAQQGQDHQLALEAMRQAAPAGGPRQEQQPQQEQQLM